jgi:hypothetical protein
MKKSVLYVLLTFGLIAGVISPATAADLKVAAKSAVSGFQESLNATLDGMNVLEEEHAKKTFDINQVNLEATAKVSATQASDLLGINNLFSPQLAEANQKKADAKAAFDANNKIKIGPGGGFFGGTNLGNYVDCLIDAKTLRKLKRQCADNITVPVAGTGTYDGNEWPDWNAGDITTIQLFNTDEKLVQDGISLGYIIPLNPTAYDANRLAYKTQSTKIIDLTQQAGAARSAATKKFDNAISVIRTTTNNALAFEDNRYEQALAELEAQQAQTETFILAAKRASKDYKTFDKAFSTALAFEYNRAQLTELADLPWTAFTSLRSLSSLSKVIALADFADAVAAKYTMANALKLNASIGNTFTKEPTFLAGAKKAKAIYVKVIKG